MISTTRLTQAIALLTISALTILFLCADSISAASTDRPNILLIYADDIGYETLNCYGGLDFKTPRLNGMAKNGLLFSRAYTSPVCTPSRVSLHTSLYTTRHGHTGVLPVHKGTKQKVNFQKMPTFAQLMRANGYATSVTGKWQLATLEVRPDHIRNAGFDSWCIWQIWRQGKKKPRHWNATYNEDGKVRDDIADRFGPDVLAEYVIEQMTEAKAAGKPFLIVHNELLPHWPIVDTPDDRVLKRKPNLGNMINYMDRLVGRLLDAVEKLGVRDKTYVVFMGDNGTDEPYFKNPKAGQPGEGKGTRHTRAGNVNGGKGDLNDAGTHVPLLVWGPKGVPRGKVCDDLIDVVDLFPTFCELSDTKIPDSLSIDGRSFAAQVHGRPETPRTWVHHGIGGGENVFDGSWRLARSGKLIDARRLPNESVAPKDEPAAQTAMKELTTVFNTIPKRSGVVSTKLQPKPMKLVGIVIDDLDAKRIGKWKLSPIRGQSYGTGYHHDLAASDGKCSATFTAKLPKPGRYEVRISWTSLSNRATNVPVTITHKDGTETIKVNQRQRAPIGGLFLSLGKFDFDTEGSLTITNEGTDGHVIIDSAQWIPAK